jgi:DNA-binding response OmpR family regulator
MGDLTILVVDDESRMRKLIRDFLIQKNYNILEAEDGEKALKVYEENKEKISLILLDVMMPKLDGWSVLRNIRQENKKLPIVMLTARAEEQDELFGFELGVDEYITKPFSPKILVARVEAILKRSMPEAKELKSYDGIVIDNEGRTVTVDGKQVELSFREYELLKYLLDNENIALSRDKILNTVWNYDYYGDSRTIDSHIKKIRHKLGKKGKHIQTIRGIGYKFEIISENPDELTKEILEKLHHGVTQINVVGKYSSTDKYMTICIVRKREIGEMMKIVKKYKGVFASFSKVNEVFGRFHK